MDNRTDEQKAKDAEKILGFLTQIRQPYEPMIDNIIEYIHHSRRKIVEKDSQKGNQTGVEVYDGTALAALNLLSDGLHGYLVSPSLRWFSFVLPGKLNFPRYSGMRSWSGKRMDEYPGVKEWLEDSEEVMYSSFLRSNFYESTPEFFKDGASIGTVSLDCEEDVGNSRIFCLVPHFRECFLAENQYGVVDTNYRVYKLTRKQMVEKWGLDHLGELDPNFKQRHESNPHEEVEIIHARYPRKDFEKERIDSRNKPWASMWILRSPLKLIEESGYDDYPSLTWRWRKNNDEWYGRSPAWDAYVDVLTANQMGKSNLIAGHKAVEPPMVGPASLRGQVNSNPKGWTWVGSMDEKNMPKPLQEDIKLPYVLEMQQRFDEKIREHFHVDFFLMLSKAAFEKVPLTATQVIEMSGEKAAILGTRIGRLQSEMLNPIIDRFWNIEERAGRLPTPPDILLEYGRGNVEVDYLGPLAQAQKRLFKTQGISAGLESMATLSSIFPEALDVIDPDDTARELLESRGFPAKCLRTSEEIEKIRKIKAKMQQEKEAAAMALEGAKTLPKMGKAVEENSPLAALGGAMKGMMEGGNA